MSYGIIFWGNSTHSSKILKIQKELLELLWEKGVEILAGICLKN